MLMMLQNLGNAASAVVEDTSDYMILTAPGVIGVSAVEGGIPVDTEDDAVTVEAG